MATTAAPPAANAPEVCLVLRGTIEVRVEEETFRLEEGDALTFGAAVPHTWRVAEPTASSRILWILAPALPDPQGSVR